MQIDRCPECGREGTIEAVPGHPGKKQWVCVPCRDAAHARFLAFLSAPNPGPRIP